MSTILLKKLLILILLLSAVIKSDIAFAPLLSWGLLGIITGYLAIKQNRLFYIFDIVIILFVGLAQNIYISYLILAIGFYILFIFLTKLMKKELKAYYLLGLFILVFWLINIANATPVIKLLESEPIFNQYTRDTNVYLKTYYLMNRGVNYYDAFAIGFDGDFRTKGLPYDVWAYRLPPVFVLWQLFTFHHATLLFPLFLVYASLCLFLIYLIGSKLSNQKLALIPVFIILPYFLFASLTSNLEFLQMDWWGIAPMLLCILGIIDKSNRQIVLGATLAIFCRELYLIPLFSLGLLSLIYRKWHLSKNLLIAVFLFILLFVFHSINVFDNLPFSWSAFLGGRSHQFGLEFVHQVLANGSTFYLFSKYRIFSLYLLLNIILAIFIYYWRKKQRFIIAVLMVFFIPTLLSFAKIGLCCWTDNWGTIVDPFIILTTGLMVSIFHQQKLA